MHTLWARTPPASNSFLWSGSINPALLLVLGLMASLWSSSEHSQHNVPLHEQTLPYVMVWHHETRRYMTPRRSVFISRHSTDLCTDTTHLLSDLHKLWAPRVSFCEMTQRMVKLQSGMSFLHMVWRTWRHMSWFDVFTFILYEQAEAEWPVSAFGL